MLLRKYRPEDCSELAKLFYDTVHSINLKDYTEEEVNVWATGIIDINRWNKLFLEHYTIIAEINGRIVGFGDIDANGYLDKLFVHKDYQNQGIATLICSDLEKAVGNKSITTHASITARGFFEKRGYKVLKKQRVERQGILLINYVMKLKR